MIVETSSNQIFIVRESANHPQAWIGTAAKKTKGGYVPKKGAKEVLVRKAASRIVEA